MKSTSDSRRRPVVEEIEPRILYSADLAPVGFDTSVPVAGSEYRVLEASGEFQAEVAAEALPERRELVFIDGRIPNLRNVAADVMREADASHIEIVVLDPARDGIEQIGEALTQRSGLAAIHVLSHGNAGAIELGGTVLDLATLHQNATRIQAWGSALSEHADLLIYGCDVAQDDSGRALLRGLADLTGADVAASDDPTGSAALGGDWEFEYLLGNVETQVAVSAHMQALWSGVLASVTVSTTADQLDGDTSSIAALLANQGADGKISLREAIIATNNTVGADTISLTAGTYTLSRVGAGENAASTGDLDITGDLTINGAGANTTVINGAGADRVFELLGSTVTLTGLTVQNGVALDGGGIRVDGSASLTLRDASISGNAATSTGGGILVSGTLSTERVTIEGNSADVGGGVYVNNLASVSLVNTTVSGNTAASNGGAIYTRNIIDLTNSTIAFNTAAGAGGIHKQGSGTVNVKNTILANNTGGNASGPLNSLGNNIDSANSAGLSGPGDKINTDPLLGLLQYNGGPTKTHALLAGSPAIDTGTATGAPTTDQRDVARLGTTDIGAYEYSIIAYEPFAYAAGPLNGANGGIGWAATWSNVGTATTVTAAGLTDPLLALPVGGGAVQWVFSSPFQNVTQTRDLATTLGAASTTTWLSFLVKPAGTGVADYAGVQFGSPAASVAFAGYNGSTFVLEQAGGAGRVAVSGISPSAGQTYLLTVKLDFTAGADNITLYVNPTAGLAGPDSAFVVTMNSLDLGSFTQISLAGGRGFGSNNAAVDELRLGVAYFDVAPAASSIAGTVFNDVDGDADIAEAGTLRFAGATVRLYRDNGNGAPGAGDSLTATTTTNASGQYAFNGLADGDYWVVIDSKTLGASGYNGGYAADDVWADQTYGVAGAMQGTGTLSSAGALYGGRYASISDNASTLTTSEHITRVSVAGAAVTGVDVGFSFSTIVNARGDTSDDDGGPSGRVQQGSLRQFLINSNAITGTQTANFSVGSGAVTITPAGPLPLITDAVVLDATTQEGFAGVPLVEINGDNAGGSASGFVLNAGASGSTIRGFVLNRFHADLIQLLGSDNNVIAGNYLGTDLTGMNDRGAEDSGVLLNGGASGNRIGGTTAADRNVISGNDYSGVNITGSGTINNRVEGNFIGTAINGTSALGNSAFGVVIWDGASGNQIGGSLSGAGNLIANNYSGVIVDANSVNAVNNAILGNQIFANAALGIDLYSAGVRANDLGDGDTGPNNYQNYPVLASARTDGTQINLAGALNSTANTPFRIEFFASAAADASLYGEAERYLGFVTVTTDAAGNASFDTWLTVPVVVGESISATATRTDPTFSTFYDTSEFAKSIAAVSLNSAPINVLPGPQIVDEDAVLAIAGLAVSDVDGNLSSVQLGVGSGTLNLSLAGGATISAGALSTGSITLAGTQAQLNAALATLTYQGDVEFSGTDTLTIVSADADALTDIDGVAITVNPVNDAPLLTAPGAQSVIEGALLVFSTGNGNAISIADVDAGAGTLQLTLTGTGGTLSLAATAGLSFITGTGSNDATMTFTGSLASINTALDGLGFIATPNLPGGASLAISLSDLGNTGSGGPQGAAVAVPISVAGFYIDPVGGLLTSEDGASANFDVVLRSAPSTDVTISVTSSDTTEGTVALTSLTFTPGNWSLPQTVTVTGVDDVLIDGDQTYSVITGAATSSDSSYGGLNPVDIGLTNVDSSVPGITVSPTTGLVTTEAGGTAEFSVVLATQPFFDVVIPVSSSNTAEGTVSTPSLTFTPGNWNVAQTVTVTGVNDFLNDGTAAYTVVLGAASSSDLFYNGRNAADVSLSNQEVANVAPANAVPGMQFTAEDTAVVFSTANGNAIAVADPDAGSNPLHITLAVSNGIVTLSGVTGLTFTSGANGTSAMMFTGSAVAVNSALEGLTFAPDADFAGAASLQIRTDDQGNSGTGGARTALSVVDIDVAAVNDAPTASVPAAQTVAENAVLVFSSTNGNAISVSDVDAQGNALLVSLNAVNGALTLAGITGLTLTAGTGTNDTAMSFTGTLANINAALDGLVFTADANFNGAAGLGITVDDLGSTGSGGGQSAGAGVAISVTAVNSAPSGADNTVSVQEDMDYVFSIADFGFTDPNDAPANNLLEVQIATLPTAGALTNNGAAVVVGQLIGAADIGAGRLRFTPAADASGASYASFSFQVRDDGGTASGGVDLDPTPRGMTVDVGSQNDAPVHAVPGGQSVAVNTPLVFSAGGGNAIWVTDVDIGAGSFSVALTALNGTLTLGGTAGLSGLSGNGTAAVAFSASLSELDNALEGLTFTPDSGFVGATSILLRTDDQGNSGAGGPLVTQTSIGIDVTYTPLSVALSAPSLAYVENDPASALDGGLTLTAGTLTVLAGAQVSISANYASGEDLLAFNAGALPAGVSANWNASSGMLSFSGAAAVAQYEALLRTVTYQNTSESPSTLTRTVMVRVDDGVATAAGARQIAVTAVNDAPSGLALSNNAVNENIDTAGGYVVGTLSTSDLDAGDTHTYSVAGGNDAAKFSVIGSQLNLTDGVLDFETIASYQVIVRSTDSGGLSVDRTFTVVVTDLNEAPSMSVIADQTLNEGSSTGALALLLADPDTVAGALTVTATSSDTLRIPNGNLVLGGSGANRSVTVTPVADAYGGPVTVTLSVSDGVNSAQSSFQVTIAALADTPTVSNAVTVENTQTTSGLVLQRNAADGAEVTHFKITAISGGALYQNDGTTIINSGDFISVAAGNAGLKFTPTAGSTAPGTFQVQASMAANDSGLGGGVATAVVTVNAAATLPPPSSVTDPVPALLLLPPVNFRTGTVGLSPSPAADKVSAPDAGVQEAAGATDGGSASLADALAAVSATASSAESADDLDRVVFGGPAVPVLRASFNQTYYGPSAGAALGDGADRATGPDSVDLFALGVNLPVDLTAPEAISLEAFRASLGDASWVGAIDSMRDEINGRIHLDDTVVASSVALGGSLSVGYVIWLLRGGLLLTSLLSSLPAWQAIDPMPVLAKSDDEEEEESADESDPLERLFGMAREAFLAGVAGRKVSTGRGTRTDSLTPDNGAIS